MRLSSTSFLISLILLFSTTLINAQNAGYASGQDNRGQLANGPGNMNTNVPLAIDMSGALMGEELEDVSAGGAHSLFLTTSGMVFASGDNRRGRLGIGSNVNEVNVPTRVDLTGVTDISAGEQHSLFIADGKAYAAGNGDFGRLGTGSSSSTNSPTLVTGFSALTVTEIAAGREHSLFVTSDGRAWAAGRNNNGQLGIGTNTNTNIPTLVVGLTDVVAVAAGSTHSLFLLGNGQVYATGRNNRGQLCNDDSGPQASVNTPILIGNALASKEVVAIAAGGEHSVFLTKDNMLFTCGRAFGLGMGHPDVDVPTSIPLDGALDGETIVAISAMDDATLLLSMDGTAYGAGLGPMGQLGVGENGLQHNFLPVVLEDVTALDMGGSLSLFIVDTMPNCTMTCSAGQHLTEMCTCEDCGAGFFSEGGQVTNCTMCPPGTASNQARAASCPLCTLNTFSPNAGATVCTECPEGQITTMPGATMCVEESNDCTMMCSAGQYLTEMCTCEDCGAGFFSAGGQVTNCTLCLPGTASNQARAASCPLCALNTFSPNAGATMCMNCPEGQITTMPGATMCVDQCQTGTFRDASGNCLPCPEGTYSNRGVSGCIPCPAGTFSRGAGARECIVCAAGTFAIAAQGVCTSCPPGSTSVEGASACTMCPAGTFNPGLSPTCVLCAPGTVSAAGASTCNLCQHGSTSLEGGAVCIPCKVRDTCSWPVGGGSVWGGAQSD